MPVTINIPNSNNTNPAPTVNTPAPVVNNPAPQAHAHSTSNNNAPMSQPNNNNSSDAWWNQPGGVMNEGGMSSNGKRLTPQERVELIEKLFLELLGRKADTRDINYYKYSTLSEEEMRKQLITGKEHKQLITDGREFTKMRDRALQSETRVKILEGQIKDQVQEFQHLSEILDEKNKHIQELRVKLNNPYNLIDHSQELAKKQADQYRQEAAPEAKSPEPVNNFQAPTPSISPIIPETKKSTSFVKFVSGKIKEILP